MLKTGFGLLVSFVQVGCVATGKQFSEFNNLPESKPKPGFLKAIVYRTTDSMMMSARTARIKLNGSEVGACDRGGFFILVVVGATFFASLAVRVAGYREHN